MLEFVTEAVLCMDFARTMLVDCLMFEFIALIAFWKVVSIQDEDLYV